MQRWQIIVAGLLVLAVFLPFGAAAPTQDPAEIAKSACAQQV
jgi:hypothetical protein